VPNPANDHPLAAASRVKNEPVEVPSLATTSPSRHRFFFPSLPSYQTSYHHLLLAKLEPQSPDRLRQPSAGSPHQQLEEGDSKQQQQQAMAHQQLLSPSFLDLQQQRQLMEAAQVKKRTSSGGSAGKQQHQQQAFTCQKCGKSYNWNYNLNRHMRFECGIGNKFECSVCHKRFPYKQNAAIHMKWKHKVLLKIAINMLP
jgi:hypothetical protein